MSFKVWVVSYGGYDERIRKKIGNKEGTDDSDEEISQRDNTILGGNPQLGIDSKRYSSIKQAGYMTHYRSAQIKRGREGINLRTHDRSSSPHPAPLFEAEGPRALLPLLQLTDACLRARRIDVLPAALEQRLRRAQLRGEIRLARGGGGACAGCGRGRGEGRGPRTARGRGRPEAAANAGCMGAGAARAADEEPAGGEEAGDACDDSECDATMRPTGAWCCLSDFRGSQAAGGRGRVVPQLDGAVIAHHRRGATGGGCWLDIEFILEENERKPKDSLGSNVELGVLMGQQYWGGWSGGWGPASWTRLEEKRKREPNIGPVRRSLLLLSSHFWGKLATENVFQSLEISVVHGRTTSSSRILLAMRSGSPMMESEFNSFSGAYSVSLQNLPGTATVVCGTVLGLGKGFNGCISQFRDAIRSSITSVARLPANEHATSAGARIAMTHGADANHPPLDDEVSSELYTVAPMRFSTLVDLSRLYIIPL
ncbi:hypothetical protein C8R44DRAFT_862231 [Mycena epipterygia]|nr:hypothetical protein C8R44DRAFT_862231 [Mycena epipterygia]